MALNKIDISMLEDAGTSGQVLTSDGTNWTSADAAAPLPAVGPDGNVLTSDGTDWASEASAAVDGDSVFPFYKTDGTSDNITITSGQFPFYKADGTLDNIAAPGGGDGLNIGIPLSSVAGDTLYHDGSVYARLPKGTAAQLLTMNAGATAPEWATPFPAAGGAWTQIGTMVGDDSGALTITGMDTTYDKYAVSISNLRAAYQGGGTHGKIRLGTSGGIIYSSNSYRRTMLYMMDSNGPHLASGYATEIAAAEGSVEQDIRGGWDAMFYIDAPRGAQRVKLYGHTAWTLEGGDPANVGMNMFSGILAASGQAVDRVQAFFTSGNVLSGRMTVYGISHGIGGAS